MSILTHGCYDFQTTFYLCGSSTDALELLHVRLEAEFEHLAQRCARVWGQVKPCGARHLLPVTRPHTLVAHHTNHRHKLLKNNK